MTTWKRVKLGEHSSVLQNEKQKRHSIWLKLIHQLRFIRLPRLSLLTALFGVVMVLGVMFTLITLMGGLTGNLSRMLFSNVAHVFGQELMTDAHGKTNILLVGVGGGTHEGPDLTDTLMIASIDQEKKTVSLLSLPRDLYVALPKGGGMKINGVYEYGLRKGKSDNQNTTGEGDQDAAIELLKETVEKVTDVDLQYYVKVNFQGFIDTVDQLGGIDVEVPQTFIDRQYPDNNYGYTTFFLRAGKQTLDGETALKYARSRHSTSDFDRAKRQQVILNALREKALQKDLLTNTNKLKRLYSTLSENISTDLNMRELLSVAGFANDLPKGNISSMVLTDDPVAPGGLLYSPSRDMFGGASVLLPTGATASQVSQYKAIHQFTQFYFSAPELYTSPPRILIYNGTERLQKRISGVGNKLSQQLNKYGIEVERAANLPKGLTVEQSQIVYFDKRFEKNVLDTLELLFPLQRVFIESEKKQQSVPPIAQQIDSDEALPLSLEELLKQDGGYYDLIFIIGNDYSEYLSK